MISSAGFIQEVYEWCAYWRQALRFELQQLSCNHHSCQWCNRNENNTGRPLRMTSQWMDWQCILSCSRYIYHWFDRCILECCPSRVFSLCVPINTSVTFILNLISTCIDWNVTSIIERSRVIEFFTSIAFTISSINSAIFDNWVTVILGLSYSQVLVNTFVALSVDVDVDVFATEFDVRVTGLEILRSVVIFSALVTDLITLTYTVGNCDIAWCSRLIDEVLSCRSCILVLWLHIQNLTQ